MDPLQRFEHFHTLRTTARATRPQIHRNERSWLCIKMGTKAFTNRPSFFLLERLRAFREAKNGLDLPGTG